VCGLPLAERGADAAEDADVALERLHGVVQAPPHGLVRLARLLEPPRVRAQRIELGGEARELLLAAPDQRNALAPRAAHAREVELLLRQLAPRGPQLLTRCPPRHAAGQLRSNGATRVQVGQMRSAGT